MRFDTSEFPGITAVLLSSPDERNGRIRIENDASRAFQVNAGRDRLVVISPGGVKEFDVEGETFSMGWHVPLDPAHAWPFPDEPKAVELEKQIYTEGSRPDTFIEKPGQDFNRGLTELGTPIEEVQAAAALHEAQERENLGVDIIGEGDVGVMRRRDF